MTGGFKLAWLLTANRACVLCQHRKIKCDRSTPCSNCVKVSPRFPAAVLNVRNFVLTTIPKANVTCTPSTPAPARKRRRPNQDLQQRLARCEELLQEYATAKPPNETSEQSSVDEPVKSMGTLIIDDSGVRFMDSFLWANVHDEVCIYFSPTNVPNMPGRQLELLAYPHDHVANCWHRLTSGPSSELCVRS